MHETGIEGVGYSGAAAALPGAAAGVAAPALPASDALASLMHRVQDRDEAALGELYDATSGRLYALAHAILREPRDAEEAVCDCYVQCWQEAARYDPGRAGVMAWLSMMCRSRALDRLRRRRRDGMHVDVEAAEDIEDPRRGPFDLLSLLEEGSAVHAALAKLPANRRELIALAFLRGMTHEEIATVKKMPVGTVKSYVRRGLLQLRDAIDAGVSA